MNYKNIAIIALLGVTLAESITLTKQRMLVEKSYSNGFEKGRNIGYNIGYLDGEKTLTYNTLNKGYAAGYRQAYGEVSNKYNINLDNNDKFILLGRPVHITYQEAEEILNQ